MIKNGTKVKIIAGSFLGQMGTIIGHGAKQNTYGIRLNKVRSNVWLYDWKIQVMTAKRKTIWK